MAIFNKRVTIHTDYYYRQFLTKTLSCGYCVSLFISLMVIFLPFILTFTSGRFWIKTNNFQEQPLVTYKNELFANFLFINSDTGAIEAFEYSTVKPIHDSSQNTLNSVTVASYGMQSKSNDDLYDQWNITMIVKSPGPNFQMRQAQVITAFDYQLQTDIKLQMEGLAVMQVDLPFQLSSSIGNVKAVGSLEFKQKGALYGDSKKRTIYNDNFFDNLELQSAESLLLEYSRFRNETTAYNYQKTVTFASSTQSFVTIDMVVKVPKYQDVLIIPGFWFVMKYAWVQYLSVFILYYVILQKGFLQYLVQQKVFENIQVTDLNLKYLKTD